MTSGSAKILMLGRNNEAFLDYQRQLEKSCYAVHLIPDGARFLDEVLTFGPHLILLDLTRPGADWAPLFGDLRISRLTIPVIPILSLDTLNEAVELIRDGAADFLVQPTGFQTLLFRIRKALETYQIREEMEKLQSEVRFRRNQDYIIGASPKIQSLLGQIQKASPTDLKVLITGETGSGKELVARAIHYNSRRAGMPFIAVNCSAIPEPLLENQLFGHMKGSFTGADADVKGLLEEADQGVLFLDEIGDLPLTLQVKLLQVLESGEYRRVGGTETLRADIRIITATHKNLKKEMEEGRFREDLFYRINTFPIHVPPLRERREDIPLLVNHFFTMFQKEINPDLQGFSTSAVHKFMFHHWPGNVRELENRVRQAMIHSPGPMVYREDIVLEEGGESPPFKSYKEAKSEFEKNYLMNVLRMTNGNVALAARRAKKDRKDFYDAMKKHGIRSKDFRSP